jgi:5,5'-dehydrodivanillate O-demethylase
MLSEAKNKILTQVGPGTPMGDYLRRFWHPIAGAAEFDEKTVRAIRLMGEDLTLYKDLSGTYGLVDRHCPHRRADLSFGYVEDVGIRCNYHGWRMDETGACVEQPFEETFNPKSKLKDRCAITAYPVREVAGLLFAYMGPAPVPQLPIWEPFTWSHGFIEVITADVPCNWFQCQENSCDPVHFEWMHDNWSVRQRGELGPYAPKHFQVAFDEFEYGFTYRRRREGQEETDPMWTTGRVALWPNGFYVGGHFEWRVPVDDENTLSVAWFFTRLPIESEPIAPKKSFWWQAPIKDAKGEWIASHVMNQDIVAWVGQGRIADRSKENLGASDRGIAMIRNRFFEEVEAVESGAEAKGEIRDELTAKSPKLPIATVELFRDGLPRKDYLASKWFGPRIHDFRWHAGQPEHVRDAFRRAVLGEDYEGRIEALKAADKARGD